MLTLSAWPTFTIPIVWLLKFTPKTLFTFGQWDFCRNDIDTLIKYEQSIHYFDDESLSCGCKCYC